MTFIKYRSGQTQGGNTGIHYTYEMFDFIIRNYERINVSPSGQAALGSWSTLNTRSQYLPVLSRSI